MAGVKWETDAQSAERTVELLDEVRQCFRRRYADRVRARIDHWRNISVSVDIRGERLAFSYWPYCREVSTVEFKDHTVDLQQPGRGDIALLREYPRAFNGLATAVSDFWEATFREPCPHAEAIYQARQALGEALEAAQIDASLSTLIEAITEHDREYAELVFDVDEPLADQTDIELSTLFEQPIEAVVYQDNDLALLVPGSGNPARWRRAGFSREAYVVGRDDTPSGFFVHAVDGTTLTVDATVTRVDIRAAMGFDRSLAPGEDDPSVADGQRIWLQGDLCVERLQDGEAFAKWLAEQHRAEVERAVTAEYVDQFFRERGLDQRRDAVEIAGRGPELRVRISPTESGRAAAEAIEQLLGVGTGAASRETRGQSGSNRSEGPASRLEQRLADYLVVREDEDEGVIEKCVADRVR